MHNFNVILSNEEIIRITKARGCDPFSILGMHKLNDNQLVVRCYNPQAIEVYLLANEEKIRFNKITEDGLFELVIDGEEIVDYKLEYNFYNTGNFITRDVYSFLPIITDYDLYLFGEGNNHRIYEKLGSTPMKVCDTEGTLFAVWAPEALRVSVVGSFNNWDGRVHQMRSRGSSGVYELFIPHVCEGDLYKFEILAKDGSILLKADPYAFYSELRPATSSIVYEIDNKFEWTDQQWLDDRKKINWFEKPISTYEVHLGSWRRNTPKDFLSYRELADSLVKYVVDNNYTHVELMPVAEHPLDESWGYQITGYYAATSRFGKPEELMYLINEFHKNGIGVLLDWVPGHFPKDAHGLGNFDGSSLYEHDDPRQGEHKDWGTYIPNFGRNEVKNFFISNALFWLEKYHIDGLRVDAVASMLYLDYSREEGEWIPNHHGGRENLDAIEFLKYFNSISHQYYPGILTIAEESTAFPGITMPPYLNGLGFSMKWNMGWMNDSLEYIEKDPIYRKHHQGQLTFSLVYAFSENFKLVISHDEVVHGKKSLLDKMPGDIWQKFANLRLFNAYTFAHPGKKLFFMGCEFGQWAEWNCNQSLDWHLLENDNHKSMQNYIKNLNKVYKENKALWEVDFDHWGFEWIDFQDQDRSIISFARKSKYDDEIIVCIFNFTPEVYNDYRIGVPKAGFYEEILNSDSAIYGGANVGNLGGVNSEEINANCRDHSIALTIPPLGALYLRLKK